MQMIADASKISKTLHCNHIFTLNVLLEPSINFTQLQQFLLKRILVFSHKMVFTENEAALLCVTTRERARASNYSYNLVHNFLMYILPLKSSVFVVYFSNTFWHGNVAFPKGSSQNEIVPLLVISHLSYSKRRV